MQLFLIDYANLYIAKVIKVSNEDFNFITPKYYKDENLDIKSWFIISYLRELVGDDFKSIKDNFCLIFILPVIIIILI